MKKISLLVLIILVVGLFGCQENITNTTTDSTTTTTEVTTTTLEEKYVSDHNVYTLNVNLDEDSSKLFVEGEIYFINDDYDLDELYLTMYPNAYNPTENEQNISIGYITIDDIECDYTVTGVDHTQIYIDLGYTLGKGERISIKFGYHFTFWDNQGRITEYSNEYLVMWFYPFVAVYDDEGWNIDPYSFMGESYYNTIGDYYVRINTPLDYQVAASGGLVDTLEILDRVEFSYELLNARDFSFSASKHYTLYERIISGRTYSIYSLLPLSDITEENVFRIVTESFDILEEQFGDYPYQHYTLQLGNFFGMESTGIAYCSYNIDEATIVHEIIHQWFFSMVGNDQSDESFVDEAITTYVTSIYYYELFGTTGYENYLAFRSSLNPRFVDRFNTNLGETLLKKVDEFGDNYAYLIYYHGPTMFKYYVDEFLSGDIDAFYDILKVYFETYQYEVASLDNLLDVIEAESGIDNTKAWFMMQIEEFQDLDNRPI